MELIALTPSKYGSRRLAVGETFEAKPRDAKLLVALGRATAKGPDGIVGIDGPDDKVGEPGKIEDLRDVVAQIEEEEISPRTGRPKRVYRRRDMRAEK